MRMPVERLTAVTVSLGTKAKEYLYSLSISPSAPLTRKQYYEAIRTIEHRLGLADQPRAVVFHVKEGREHCHVVWSRIDVEKMRAIHMAHDRRKLDQYLTGVREVEQRIAATERFGPSPDPAVETPVGIPADFGEHMQIMYDLLVLAFQTDSTRIATLLLDGLVELDESGSASEEQILGLARQVIRIMRCGALRPVPGGKEAGKG